MSTPEENMKATREDRLSEDTSRGGGFPVRAVLIVVVVAIALLLLFYPGGDETAPEEVVAPPPAVEKKTPEPLPPAEDIPEPVEPEPLVSEEPEPEEVPEAAPLPTPEDSDPLMREQIAAAGAGAELSGFTEGDNLVQRLVALVDGSSRGVLLRKILPMQAPQEAFPVEDRDGETIMSPSGFSRYDSYVDSVAALDTDTIVASFHNLRPLYESAYSQLGLPADDLDNAVIRTLDRIIATPEIEQPIALERTSVMYTYADPELEGLPTVQKQLLRMGPDNVRRLKAKARELREGLLASGE